MEALSATRPARSPGPAQDLVWLQSPWLWAVLCLAAALPVAVCGGLPPLTDLGGHLGRYAIQVDAGRSADLRQWYSFQWDLLPNLGVDLLVHWLAPLLGLERALTIIVMAIPVIQVAGFLMLARVVHGRVTPFTLFALPLAYGYPFQFGFVNFTLSVGLATCALALWIALGARGWVRLRWLLFMPIAQLLWVCHLVGWALFCIFAAANEVAKARDQGMSWRQAALQVVMPLTCVLTPRVVKLLWASNGGGHGQMDELFNIPTKVGFLFMPLRDAWFVWDFASVLVLMGLIGWGWRSARFTRHHGLALGVVGLATIYAVMPGTILGSSMADMRLVPALFAMALIAIRPEAVLDRRLGLLLVLGGLSFTGARLAGNAASLSQLHGKFEQDLAILDTLPRGTTVISLSVEPCDQTFVPWRRERRTHLGGYAIARHHDFSNDQWVIPGGQLLSVHNPAAGVFSTDMSELAAYPDCLLEDRPYNDWVRQVPRVNGYLWILYDGIVRPIPGWRPIRKSPGSVLYAPS
jgi:hypothetical protein